MKQLRMPLCAALVTFAVITSSTLPAKAVEPFVAGLIVGGIAASLLNHYPHPNYPHYYRRLYHGVPAVPRDYPYQEACVRGPNECYEVDECWRASDGRPQCGIRRHCRRRVYCN